MTRPITRAGHIQDGRNRFCGADVFDTLERRIRTPTDLLILSFGGRALDDEDREVLRCVSLAVASPDPRVWPLKLTRVLASRGNLFAAFHGAQLANFTDIIGPNAATSCAGALATIASRVDDPADTARLDAVIAEFLEPRPIVGGFGVPFRDEDERLVELERLLAYHPITLRAPWLIAKALGRAIGERNNIRPNVVSAICAILLDLAIPPRRAGLLLGVLMTHTYAAHAVEAVDTDGPLLGELDFETHVDYRGRAPRATKVDLRRSGGPAPR